MNEYEFHECASIFPLIVGPQYVSLVADIKANGLRVPIKLFDGKILDGRNRYNACRECGVPPRFEKVETDDPIAYVLSLNLHHRHLSVGERAICAAKAREWYDRQAKERMRVMGKDGALKQHGKQGCDQMVTPHIGKSRDQVGVAFGVSGQSVDRATHVLRDGVPELVKAVEEQRITITCADRATKLSPDEQRRIAAGHKMPPKKPQPELVEGKVNGVGITRANQAIDVLKRIPKNDKLRDAGFAMVAKWIRVNR